MTPNWLHILTGGVTVTIAVLVGWQPPAVCVGMLLFGAWHEFYDGDLTANAGHPWNGLWDIGWFLLVPVLWWGLA